jgi:hypothetical protein
MGIDEYYQHCFFCGNALIFMHITTYLCNDLKKDRTIKVDKYAQAGIAEYWIIIPKERLIEVYRSPKDGRYLEKHSYSFEDQWELKVLGLEVRGKDLLI